ncbi:MAG: hypothetical protein NZ561_05060 [Phycisphaerae bacterium]|nr:hypothetical protein [Phycisphaerae bacterium]MDW8262471.1 hypothetical protein [Phycisphaerales bacterium]
MSDTSGQNRASRPGKGFFGWLGRQVGYVTKALKADVSVGKTVYRSSDVQELPLPENPRVILRRTTTDEVIVKEITDHAAQRARQDIAPTDASGAR